MWRKLHRWISIIAAVYLLNMAITGSLLAWDEWSLRLPGGGLSAAAMRAMASPPALPDVDLSAAAMAAYQKAQALAPDAPLTGLRMAVVNDELQSTTEFGGAYPGRIIIRAADGKRLQGPPGPATAQSVVDYHQFLKRLHRGDFIGNFNGRFLSIAAGFCLLFLSVSGIVMFVEQLRLQRRRGNRRWFWS